MATGEWVEDRHRTVRWFVPYGGVGDLSIDQLRDEAFEWQGQVHKIQKRRKREENPVGYAGEMLAKTALIGAGVALFGLRAAAMTQGAAPPAPGDDPLIWMLEDSWEDASH